METGVSVILRIVLLALGMAVTAMTDISGIQPQTAAGMLGLGLAAVIALAMMKS
ncbi:MAG: hypothetical protein Q4C54_10195 [Clostridia bacterium]|nr:hypothetical protein [Clostridia bacterium]